MKRQFIKPLLAGMLLLSGLFLVVTQFGRLERFLGLLGHIDSRWITAATLFQFGTYFSLALVWKQALRHGGIRCSFRSLLPLAIAKLFADQALPTGGISGIAFFVGSLRCRGISAAVGMGTMLVSILSYYGAYVLAALASILLLWLYHEMQAWIVFVSVIFFAVAVAIPAAALLLKQLGARELPEWLKRFPVIPGLLDVYAAAPAQMIRRPVLLFQATLFHVFIFLFDAATLWAMLQSLGRPVSLLQAFPCFVLASMVATLLLRGFTLWLPMLPGLWLTRRELL